MCFLESKHMYEFIQLDLNEPKTAYAADLIKQWGLLGGFINGISPLPAIPLILAATALENSHYRVVFMLATLALGRFAKYLVMAASIYVGKSAVQAATAGSDKKD
eukprot:TRINITY_DN113129_c0_g1_i2.p1 TRINITY_DN113129_c0_g1~~TRINITY_DN113129_c0_g1_i2.p1  ORF type:complete len:105 (-),score=20.82 TRINITY_DN113129_c0_g1_i2:572-886(-)